MCSQATMLWINNLCLNETLEMLLFRCFCLGFVFFFKITKEETPSVLWFLSSLSLSLGLQLPGCLSIATPQQSQLMAGDCCLLPPGAVTVPDQHL